MASKNKEVKKSKSTNSGEVPAPTWLEISASKKEKTKAKAKIVSKDEIEKPVRRKKPKRGEVITLKVSPRQFTRARKYRWENAAGFLADMRKNEGAQTRKTIAEWQVLWIAFWKRPVKS